MTDRKQMLPSDVILLANGIRYRLGRHSYAEYEKSLNEWKESADITNSKLQEIFRSRAYADKQIESLEFEKTADQALIDLTQATKVVYPAEDPRNQLDTVDVGKKYHRPLYGLCGKMVITDVYRVLDAYPTGSSGLDHAVKKILLPGNRGHKDRLTDLKEARNSIDQAIKLEEQKANAKRKKE